MAHPLNRLAHGCGDSVRHAKIDIRHFFEIPLQRRIAFNQREFRQLAGYPAQEADDCLDHGDFAVIELISFGTILSAMTFKLAEDPPPAQFKPHPDVRIEVVIAPDAADDVVTVKECFQLVEGIRRIPRIRI